MQLIDLIALFSRIWFIASMNRKEKASVVHFYFSTNLLVSNIIYYCYWWFIMLYLIDILHTKNMIALIFNKLKYSYFNWMCSQNILTKKKKGHHDVNSFIPIMRGMDLAQWRLPYGSYLKTVQWLRTHFFFCTRLSGSFRFEIFFFFSCTLWPFKCKENELYIDCLYIMHSLWRHLNSTFICLTCFIITGLLSWEENNKWKDLSLFFEEIEIGVYTTEPGSIYKNNSSLYVRFFVLLLVARK